MNEDTKPIRNPGINVDAVRELCERGGKDYAVVISHDRKAGTFQYTTWGKSPEDKVEAANASRWLAEQMDPRPTEVTWIESFHLDAAKVKFELEETKKKLAIVEQQRDAALRLASSCPDVTLQRLSDCGLNPFAVQLLVESWEAHPKGQLPTRFTFRGAEILISAAKAA